MGRQPDSRPGQESKPTTTLGDAVGSFLRSSGIATLLKYPAITAAWERVVGAEIAEHTKVWAFQRGVLEVTVDSSALMTDIRFCRASLLRQLQRELKRPFISGISFVLRATQEANGKE